MQKIQYTYNRLESFKFLILHFEKCALADVKNSIWNFLWFSRLLHSKKAVSPICCKNVLFQTIVFKFFNTEQN